MVEAPTTAPSLWGRTPLCPESRTPVSKYVMCLFLSCPCVIDDLGALKQGRMEWSIVGSPTTGTNLWEEAPEGDGVAVSRGGRREGALQEHPRPQHLPVLLRFRPCCAGWPSWQEEVAGHTPARHWGARRWGAGRTQEECVRTPSPGEAQQCPRTPHSHLLSMVSAGSGAAEFCLWAPCPGFPQVGTCLRTFAKNMREAPGSDLRWPRTAAD